MAKDKEKKLKSKNKKLKKKLESALRYIATLEGKDPDNFISDFSSDESNLPDSFEKLVLAVGGEHKKIASRFNVSRKNTDNETEKQESSDKKKLSADKMIRDSFYDPDRKTESVKYEGNSPEERAKNRKKHIESLIEQYCDSHNIMSDSPRKKLFDYIMDNRENSPQLVRLLRIHAGEIEQEDLNPPDMSNTDRQLTASESTIIAMNYRDKMDKIYEIECLLKDLVS